MVSRLAFGAIASLLLAPCDGSGSGSASDAAAPDAVAEVPDAAGAPVIDDVTVPEVATLDVGRGTAHIVGSIAYHSDTSQVAVVNVFEGKTGGIFRGALGGPSPQP